MGLGQRLGQRGKFAFLAGLVMVGTVSVLLLTRHRSEVVPDSSVRNPQGETVPGHDSLVGSANCRSCHEGFYQKWATSHHGLAMQPFTAEFAKKHLTPTREEIAVGPGRYAVLLDEKSGRVRERLADGTVRDYPMAHAMGGKNVYYFLTPLEKGRLQVLPLAYNVNDRRWYDMPASGVRHFPDAADAPLDWKHSAFTFNTSCYTCHVSQLTRNYDFHTDTYRTAWAEPGINCEACHGPGADHVRMCQSLKPGEKPSELKLISTRVFNTGQMNDSCAPCHAKMSPVSTAYKPGEAYFDHFDLVTLENPDFYPDGRDLGENYTMTSWHQSQCVQGGELSCMHCHTSSGRNRFAGDQANQACAPCHADKVENPTAHTFHKSESAGNRCVACHMPTTGFAAMMRSDHSMRPPMPAATLAFQSPNACNGCHGDRDAAWADRTVRQWRKRDYQAPVLARAGLVKAARAQDWSRLTEILAEIGRADRDEVTAASLLRLLASCADTRIVPAAQAALRDRSPLVRAAAVQSLAGQPRAETQPLLLAACADASRLVRVRAAAAVGYLPPDSTTREQRTAFERAAREYFDSLLARPDHWSSHYNLGNYYQTLGDLNSAVLAYERAVKLEPEALLALVNVSVAYAQQNRLPDAEKALRQALKADPENVSANLNLGMLLGEQNRLREAEACFRIAWKRDPRSASAAYNLSVIVSGDRLGEAVELARKAYDLQPHGKHAQALALYLTRQGQIDEARTLLSAFLRREPTHAACVVLLGDLYVQKGQMPEALQVYQQALREPALTREGRQMLETRLRQLEQQPRGPKN